MLALVGFTLTNGDPYFDARSPAPRNNSSGIRSSVMVSIFMVSIPALFSTSFKIRQMTFVLISFERACPKEKPSSASR
jgi:hypothetical protein